MKLITKFSTPCFGQYIPSYFRSVKSSDSTPLDWQTFYHMVTTDTTLQANTDIARKAFTEGNAHRYAVVKARVRATSADGVLLVNRRWRRSRRWIVEQKLPICFSTL
jgi:hypothetical protein